MEFREGGKGITISKSYIEKSYKEGHYIESLVLIHYVINGFMNRTFDLITSSFDPLRFQKRATQKSLLRVSNYSFLTIVNILFDMGVYDEGLHGRLKRFNSCRNKAAHELFIHLPERSELDNQCEFGIELWNEIYSILQKYNREYFEKINKLLPEK